MAENVECMTLAGRPYDQLEQYGPEWALLELVAMGTDNPSDRQSFLALLTQRSISWGELLEQSMYHKLYAMLARELLQRDAFPAIPPFLNYHIRTMYDVIQHKTSIIRKEIKRIIRAFDEEKIPAVGTKGIVLESTIYRGEGTRHFSDIDFLVTPEYKLAVMNVLKDLGYVVANLDWRTNTPRPMSREEYLVFQTTKDHIPTHYLIYDDPIAPYISVDCSMSFTWSGCPFDIPLSEAFCQHVHYDLPGHTPSQIPALTPTYHFIYIVCHLLKHAWLPSMLRWSNDVSLVRFADVARYWRTYSQVMYPELLELADRYGIQRPLLWVLAHTDRVLNTSIVEELGWTEQIDEGYLQSAGTTQGTSRHWHGTMRERLWSKNRSVLFDME